jgi:ADP-ribose pyrophosphatase YjhB (NUDIX family)
MQIIKTHFHPEIETLENKSIFTRLATRSITLQGYSILLLYTARYDDYSLPGGGLNLDEDKITGMKRELNEETGAENINNIQPFAIYEEYRPWYKGDYDIQHMISYCYTCDINTELGTSTMESYETNNGMKAMWVNIYEAINHNKNTMTTSDKKGRSIERETFLLERIADSLV